MHFDCFQETAPLKPSASLDKLLESPSPDLLKPTGTCTVLLRATTRLALALYHWLLRQRSNGVVAASVIAISERIELTKPQKLTSFSSIHVKAQVELPVSVAYIPKEWWHTCTFLMTVMTVLTAIGAIQEHQRTNQACQASEKGCISVTRAFQLYLC